MSSEYHTPGELATPCRPSDHHSYAGMFSRGMGWRHTSTTPMQQEIQLSHTHTQHAYRPHLCCAKYKQKEPACLSQTRQDNHSL